MWKSGPSGWRRGVAPFKSVPANVKTPQGQTRALILQPAAGTTARAARVQGFRGEWVANETGLHTVEGVVSTDAGETRGGVRFAVATSLGERRGNRPTPPVSATSPKRAEADITRLPRRTHGSTHCPRRNISAGVTRCGMSGTTLFSPARCWPRYAANGGCAAARASHDAISPRLAITPCWFLYIHSFTPLL